MSKRKLSTPERRATRSSGILEPIQQLLFTPRKRKKEIPEIPSDTVTAQTETVIPIPNKDVPLPARLPNNLIPYLQAQKQAVLCALTRSDFVEPVLLSRTKAFQELKELIQGTIDRQEGNSCLILGPRGIGKTKVSQVVSAVALGDLIYDQLVEHCLSSFKTSIRSRIVIRLSGHSQINDRLAMREIVRQIREQSGTDVLIDSKGEDRVQGDNDTSFPEEADFSLPPSSHLPQLISSLPSLGQPVIIVLDAFDKFTEHTRQALLYCLLDTVQSCRGALADSYPGDQSSNESDFTKKGTPTSTRNESGLLVVGITSRVDCVTLLEKRVKSRFSHRILKMESLHGISAISEFFKTILTIDPGLDHILSDGWQTMWSKSIEACSDFFSNQEVVDTFEQMFMFSKDIRLYSRLLLSCLTALSPDSPWLTPTLLRENTIAQRCSTQYPFLRGLPYPHLSLLIAAMHTSVAGQETFTFELLYDKFMAQVRLTASAPVDSERGMINMPFIPRSILLGAFEDLIDNRVFCPGIPYASHISKEFMKYRSLVTREEIKNTVDGIGQTAIKKWFYRNQ